MKVVSVRIPTLDEMVKIRVPSGKFACDHPQQPIVRPDAHLDYRGEFWLSDPWKWTNTQDYLKNGRLKTAAPHNAKGVRPVLVIKCDNPTQYHFGDKVWVRQYTCTVLEASRHTITVFCDAPITYRRLDAKHNGYEGSELEWLLNKFGVKFFEKETSLPSDNVVKALFALSKGYHKLVDF